MTEQVNTALWDDLYKQRQSLLKYPDSTFVTLLHRKMQVEQHKRVLDYGFGGGANMRVLLRRGHLVSGVEISDAVIQINQQILAEEGLTAQLYKSDGQRLPFADHSFDAIVPWHVLGYNSKDSLAEVLDEFKRILRPGGVVLGTIPAYGDVSHQQSETLNEIEFISRVPEQNGARILCLPDEESVRKLLGQENAEVGLLQCPMLGTGFSRHWVYFYAV
jgi:SAM-dependent methyltransferase